MVWFDGCVEVSVVTAADKLAAVEREIGYRRRVYAKRVEAGSMSREFAAAQIGAFEEIAEDYRLLAARERLL